jgi:hypothetical protein
MSPVAVFLVGILITAVSSCAVVWYLKPSLQGILVDLCGTAERAAFWTAFSNVTIGVAALNQHGGHKGHKNTTGTFPLCPSCPLC